MATVNELDEMIKSTEREILDLKTSHKVKSDIVTYQKQFEIPGGSMFAPAHLFRITYEDGTQPIISFVSDWGVVFGTESTNTQLLFTPELTQAWTCTLVSTRPIKSIVLLA